MELKIKSKITVGELYHFLLYHTYSSVWGFAGILISVCALLAFIQMCISGGSLLTKVCLVAAALLFLVIQPLRLYLQAQKSMLNDKGYAEPIEFFLNHDGIALTQNTDNAFYTWGEIEKVIATKKIAAIYTDKKKVFKISKRDMAGNYDEFKQIIRTYAVKSIVKLK